MKKVMFSAPYAVTTHHGTVYHAVVNGEMIKGDFGTVDSQFKAAKKAHAKTLRKSKNSAA